jgi:fructokinase
VEDGNLTWEFASHYLAALCVNMVLLVSPERIVLSGGIMNRDMMFPTIRKKVQEMLNGYINMPQITTDQIDNYIVPSAFGNDAGIVGALVLAENAYNTHHKH